MSDAKMPDLSGLMSMAQKLQVDMARAQEKLADITCEAASGGGMVSATVNGKLELVSLRLEKDVVDPSDLQMLQDLIVAAVNQAGAKARETSQKEMAKLTGSLNIPGLSNLFSR